MAFSYSTKSKIPNLDWEQFAEGVKETVMAESEEMFDAPTLNSKLHITESDSDEKDEDEWGTNKASIDYKDDHSKYPFYWTLPGGLTPSEVSEIARGMAMFSDFLNCGKKISLDVVQDAYGTHLVCQDHNKGHDTEKPDKTNPIAPIATPKAQGPASRKWIKMLEDGIKIKLITGRVTNLKLSNFRNRKAVVELLQHGGDQLDFKNMVKEVLKLEGVHKKLWPLIDHNQLGE
ncbi:phosphoprotein [Hapavirus ngaingan]|uniref:Phosphoprotein n=1 Tax=Hapavirus ngaingan TaxID=1972623 RepID=D3GGK9_9RHAB|nr:phosphoprotein [Hapavirus ngaingan]ACX83600.1 phosphoprotein [Hapavirus ngaingan]